MVEESKENIEKNKEQERPAKHKFNLPQLNLGGLFQPKIPLSELVLFTKHLSMMLEAGVSEIESLKIIQEQTKNRHFKKVLKRTIPRVEKGKFLSESLKESNGFNELFINVIKLGETSGTLPENLSYLAEEIKKTQELRSKVKGALVYPTIILIVTIIVVIALLVFVIPRITPIFKSLNVELPATTQFLVNTAGIFQNHYLTIIAGIIGFYIMFKVSLRLGAVKYFLNSILLYIPVVNKMIAHYNMANISRTISLLLRSGVNVVQAIISASESTANPVYKRVLVKAAQDIKEGKPLYTYLEKHGRLFPPTFVRMVQIGERTGNLTHNLSYLSGFYESELDEKVRNLSSVFEPVLMVVLGGLVGFIAISIITPIYEITQQI